MSAYQLIPGSSPYPLFTDDTALATDALRIENPIGTKVWEVTPGGLLNFSALGIENSGVGADQSIDTGGTIAADGSFATVVHASSAADKTGVIMHVPGGNVIKLIVNYSANSLTFAASGTSHVAAGTAAVIAAGTAVLMVYVFSKSLWYVTNL